jgi:hypothetical protein
MMKTDTRRLQKSLLAYRRNHLTGFVLTVQKVSEGGKKCSNRLEFSRNRQKKFEEGKKLMHNSGVDMTVHSGEPIRVRRGAASVRSLARSRRLSCLI